MLRVLLLTAAVLAIGCGKKDDQGDRAAAAEPDTALILDPATCIDAVSCVSDCERGVVEACALASSIHNLGYKVKVDPQRGNQYRRRYLELRARACRLGHSRLCQDSAPHGQTPDWQAIRDRCAGGELSSCLRCKASRFGDDCSRIPR